MNDRLWVIYFDNNAERCPVMRPLTIGQNNGNMLGGFAVFDDYATAIDAFQKFRDDYRDAVEAAAYCEATQRGEKYRAECILEARHSDNITIS